MIARMDVNLITVFPVRVFERPKVATHHTAPLAVAFWAPSPQGVSPSVCCASFCDRNDREVAHSSECSFLLSRAVLCGRLRFDSLSRRRSIFSLGFVLGGPCCRRYRAPVREGSRVYVSRYVLSVTHWIAVLHGRCVSTGLDKSVCKDEREGLSRPTF